MTTRLVDKEDTTVLACPRCGTPVLHHCHHDGEEIRSVEMSMAASVSLLDDYIDSLRENLEDAEENRMQVISSMMDWEDEVE